MAYARTATLTFRIKPGLKESVSATAGNEYRSITNMIAAMIRENCGRGVSRTKTSGEVVLSTSTSVSQMAESWR